MSATYETLQRNLHRLNRKHRRLNAHQCRRVRYWLRHWLAWGARQRQRQRQRRSPTLSAVPVLRTGVMNANRRLYRRDVVAAAVAKLRGFSVPGYVGFASEQERRREPAFVAANFALHGDRLTCDARLIDPAVADLLASGVCVVRTGAYGTVSADGEVTDLSLVSLAIIPAVDDAFGGSV